MARLHLGSRHAAARDVDTAPDNWRQRGNCTQVDPDVMYPLPSDIVGEVRALSVCDGCPVKDRCDQWAIEQRERHGVWGGMTERERAARLSGRITVCPQCQGGHYQRHWNQVYCIPCRRPAALTRAERMAAT